MNRTSLDAALIDAHDRKDGKALVRLYTEAAEMSEATGDQDATAFYLTQAFVFALESGCSKAASLNARLVRMGRAQPIDH